MQNREWFVRVNHNYNTAEIWILLGYFIGDDVYIYNGIDFKKYKRYESIDNPTMRLPDWHSDELLLALIDGLLKAGIKPSEPIKNTPELDAIKYHLEDMRRIVFKEVTEAEGKGE